MKKLLFVIMFLIPCSICSFWFKRKATFFIDKNTSTEYIKSILSKQVSGSVRFEQSVRKLIESGFDRFIEIGPGDTLTGFVKRIAKDMKVEGLVYEKI